MRTVCLLATVPLLLAAVACGGSDEAPESEAPETVIQSGPVDYPEDHHDVSGLADTLDLVKKNSSTYEWTAPDGTWCDGMLLNGTSSVSMYADAGDVVATTPDRTLGFKVGGDDSKVCHADMAERLADL